MSAYPKLCPKCKNTRDTIIYSTKYKPKFTRRYWRCETCKTHWISKETVVSACPNKKEKPPKALFSDAAKERLKEFLKA